MARDRSPRAHNEKPPLVEISYGRDHQEVRTRVYWGSGLTCSARPANSGLRDWFRSVLIDPIAPVDRSIGLR
jgi:hypothetical protein